MASKRVLTASEATVGGSSGGKRARALVLARLCDMALGEDLFANKLNALRAREKGILRSREATTKYAELEAKLYSLFHESGDLEFPEEEWVFDVLPELNDLEPETLDSLLSQAQTHAKYERAARELVLHERAKLEAEHASEMRSLRAELESERTRQSVSAEMRYKQLDNAAKNEREELWQEAQEKIAELEGIIDGLEEQLAGKEKELTEIAQEAESECDTLREEHLAAIERVKAAEEETDLKREASRKLKEEIIDNDRLTVANLNRIKALEAENDKYKVALHEAESENDEMRKELEKSVQLHEEQGDAEDEIAHLRALLDERESQLVALSRRMTEVMHKEEREASSLGSPPSQRRDSFFNRLPFSTKNTNSSNASSLLASAM